MKFFIQHKMKLLYSGLILLLLITGIIVYKAVAPSNEPAKVEEEVVSEVVPPADPSITVDVVFSKVKTNTLVMKVGSLGSKYKSVGYELTYDSQGQIKGTATGSKPIEVAGQDAFVRDDIYLGTCSRNVCKPDLGVSKVSVVLEFTAMDGKKSQLTKDFDL